MPRPPSAQPSPGARAVAAAVLLRVARDDAFASASLDAELDRAAQLDPRDRGLATEIAYGVLRCEPYLRQRLSSFAPRGLDGLDADTRVHLLIGAYQLLFLDRIPAFAAVSEAVEAVRRRRGPNLSRFVNAVLRRLSDQVQASGRPGMAEALRASANPWLVDRIACVTGSRQSALDLIAAGPLPPPLGLRLRHGENRDEWVERIQAAIPQAWVRPGKVSPLCINVRGAGRPADLPGADQHIWVQQEEGSQLLALSVGVRPSERVLDACAGRGNKTSLLAEIAGESGSVDAADIHPAKLEMLRKACASAGHPVHDTFAVDWTRGTGDVPEGYDRVLVDAPCSGTGTLRRRPEIVRKSLPTAVPQLQALQTEILVRAATRCRPGGRLIYAVCSVLREEAEDVVQRAMTRLPTLQPAPFDSADARALAGDAPTLRLLPHLHGTDGYFVASFVIRRT
jgi:16S rRNA (cytosine967-C5)-methyltransferase